MMKVYYENGKWMWRFEAIGEVDSIILPPVEPPPVEPPPPTNTGKIGYTVTNGAVKITGIDGTNPVILDNDFINDSPEYALVWLMADRGKINLVGNIMTINPDPDWPLDRTASHWDSAFKKTTGMKNLPVPVRGAPKALAKPSSGRIEDTVRTDSIGSNLIIAKAKEASVAKPLVIFVGGQCTSVANAYLKDPSIADKIVLFHTNGYWDGGVESYNTQDAWATYICMKRMKYVNVNYKHTANREYWYTDKNLGLSSTFVNSIPGSHPMVVAFKEWYTRFYSIEGMADATPVLWFINNGLWNSVQRKKENGAVVTTTDYDFLFVNSYDWSQYGPTIVNKFKELVA